MTALKEHIAQLPIEILRYHYELALIDSCETDSYIRDRVKNILTDYEINGDSHCVPPIEMIVDSLVQKIEDLESKKRSG